MSQYDEEKNFRKLLNLEVAVWINANRALSYELDIDLDKDLIYDFPVSIPNSHLGYI